MDFFTSIADMNDCVQNQWDVQSKSDPDVYYKVVLKFNGEIECDCKGFKYRSECWHVTHVKEANNFD